MKKRVLLGLILVIAMILSLFATGCSSNETVPEAEEVDTDIITWEISDEAKEKYDLLLQNKFVFDAETYDEQMQQVYLTRMSQELPETEVKNILNKETSMRNDVYTLDNGEDYENIVLYIHGGAWTYSIDTLHLQFCDELVDRLNAKVYMPLYPLAPEASYYETFKMVCGLYRELLEQGKPIFVMGDSAGGNISLGLAHLIKEYGYQMPEKLVLLAPCADMTFSNEEMKEIEPNDPVLNIDMCKYCAQMWAYERPFDEPALSAVFDDTSGYPDTVIFAGTNDILYPDDYILFQNMKEAGNNVKLVVGKGLWHVFSVSNIPEKQKSLDFIQNFCLEEN